uniref:GG13051 n=1 Tax=Drosophila erecta TaxID=7220 RepID=B3P4S7_DROER
MGHLQLDFHAIPKLHGRENYWQWRILLKTFLEANDLWKHNEPKEVAILVLHSK